MLTAPNRWRRRGVGWGNATSDARRESKRLETRSPRVRIRNSCATLRRTYLRRLHLLPSVPDGPLRLSTRSVDEDDSKRTLEIYQVIRSRRNRGIQTGQGAGTISEAQYASTPVELFKVDRSRPRCTRSNLRKGLQTVQNSVKM